MGGVPPPMKNFCLILQLMYLRPEVGWNCDLKPSTGHIVFNCLGEMLEIQQTQNSNFCQFENVKIRFDAKEEHSL